jgi:hypothetical protein
VTDPETPAAPSEEEGTEPGPFENEVEVAPATIATTPTLSEPMLPEPEPIPGELHEDIPSGTPPSAEEVRRWTENTAAQTVNESSDQVSFVVNKAAPYKVSKEEAEYKPKKQTRRVSRSSVKTVEYELRSTDDDELDSYEKGSRIYYLILFVLVFGMLGFASHQLYKSGVFFASSDLTVQKSDPLEGIEAEPPPPELPTVIQKIASTPTGASISINGILQEGVTPGDFAVLPGKINSISVYLLGHAPAHRNIAVPEGKAGEPLQLDLEAIDTEKLNEEEDFGQMRVRSEPPGAKVLLNGKPVGQTPVQLKKLVAGLEYHVVIRKEGFYDHVIVQHLFPNIISDLGVHKLVSKERKAAERFTEINFETKGATIVLDNALVGPSPYFKRATRNQAVRIELKAEDKLPYRRVFETKVGSVSFAPELKKIDRTPGKLTLRVSPKKTKIFLGPNEYDYNDIKKVELPPGELVVTLVSPDGTRNEVKLTIEPGATSSYSIKLSGTKPVVSKTR